MSTKDDEKSVLETYDCAETDPLPTTGVLLSDEIEFYVQRYKLIDPCNPANLKPAGYELTVGDEYMIGGNTKRLSKEADKDTLIIPPFEVVVIKTGERVNLPRFLIARWNIRVRWAYKGLLWVGGPQVDPGYVGYLFCPIYNLSDKAVTLRLGDQIALMDFVKTTPFRSGRSKTYQRPPGRVVIDDYDQLRSALYTEARKRVDDIADQMEKMSEKVSTLETRLYTTVGVTFTVFAIIVATLSLLVTSIKTLEVALPLSFYISVVLSIFAFILSLFTWSKKSYRSASNEKDLQEKVQQLDRVSLLLTVGMIAFMVVTWVIALKIIW
jgi:deoxycytidine triphosphate deaminase